MPIKVCSGVRRYEIQISFNFYNSEIKNRHTLSCYNAFNIQGGVWCFWGVALHWPSNYKHSGIPDRERLWLCVCSCVSLLICSLSFVVFHCYQRDSSSLPVSHNALLSLSGCTRGREMLGKWNPSIPSTPISPLSFFPHCVSPFLSLPCAHLICSLEVFRAFL